MPVIGHVEELAKVLERRSTFYGQAKVIIASSSATVDHK